MKYIILLIFFNSFGAECQGESFKNIKLSVWYSFEDMQDSLILHTKNIALHHWNLPLELLDASYTIWTFNDQLNITKYNIITGENMKLHTFDYENNEGESTVTIVYDSKLQKSVTFDVGVLVPKAILLSIKKEKKKKKRR